MSASQVSTGASVEWINESGAKNLTKDTGTASGDIALILVSWFENSIAAVTTPTGFAARGTLTIGGSGGNESFLTVFTRDCDGSEAANYPVTITGATTFATAALLTLRGSSAMTFVSATAGAAASSTTCTAPSVSGTSGQALVMASGTGDPCSMTTPTGMAAGTAGLQNTNTGRFFFETLVATAATGTRASTISPSRDNGAYSILINGAGAGGGGGSTPPPNLLLLGVG